MSSLHFLLNHIDLELSQFARALALPIRVFIVRMIIENGNSISKQALHTGVFSADNINKHIMELKSVGILKINGVRGQITYSIDQNVSKQISDSFTNMFQSISQLSQQTTDYPQPVTETVLDFKKDGILLNFKNFGAFIKMHRQELNISQEDFAKKINIDRAQLSRIESGKKSLNVDKLESLSKALYLDLQAVSKEYYNYRIAELIAESKA
jgi:ribosome-binding protein aMBF1 (putative translation factor)